VIAAVTITAGHVAVAALAELLLAIILGHVLGGR
jgi:hypothetical protein